MLKYFVAFVACVIAAFSGLMIYFLIQEINKLYLKLYFHFILDKKNFYSFLSYLNKFDNINNGGCGLAAYLLYLHFDCEIFCLKVPFDSFSNNKKNIPFSSKHVFVKYKKKYYDSKGELTGVNKKECFKIKPELLKQSITIPNYWNDSFKNRKLLLNLINNTK